MQMLFACDMHRYRLQPTFGMSTRASSSDLLVYHAVCSQIRILQLQVNLLQANLELAIRRQTTVSHLVLLSACPCQLHARACCFLSADVSHSHVESTEEPVSQQDILTVENGAISATFHAGFNSGGSPTSDVLVAIA